MDSQTCIKICTAYVAFLFLAYCYGLLGPTLPELKRIAHTNTDVISWLATTRALGQLIGSPIGGLAIECLPRGWVICVSMLLAAPCVAVIPFFGSVVPMAVANGLWGLISAFSVVGINMEIIYLGGTNNGPMLQALHCIYNVGLLIAPVAVEPFLKDESEDDLKDTSKELMVQSDLGDLLENHGWSYIVVPYVIGGLLAIVSSVIYFCVLCATKTETKRIEASSSNHENSYVYIRRNRLVIFITVFMFFMFCCLVETNYTTFLATFVVDYLGWSDKSAAEMTSVLS